MGNSWPGWRPENGLYKMFYPELLMLREMDLHFQPWKRRPGCGFTCPWMGWGEPSAHTRGQWGMMTMRRSQRRWAASSVQLLAAEPAPGICVCFGCMRCAGMAILQCSERKEGREERACEFPNMTLCLSHVEPCRAVPGVGRCRMLAWGGPPWNISWGVVLVLIGKLQPKLAALFS